MKKHLGFIIFFSAVIFIFLGGLISMKAAFIDGDYLVQIYPWLKVYSESIKAFNFPYWCRYFHSGFPLMAEGQIGGFYPLNTIMFFLLPFKVAYNYSVILHFILAGVFTYLYSRRLGAGQCGGSLAALLFCFGSVYAGCFYIKTIVWFPLVLLLFELYFDKQKLRYILFAALVFGFQFLAGSIQIAVYTGLFYIAYFIYQARLKRLKLKKQTFALSVFLLLSFLISLPQLILTYQLAKFSNRETATLGFALWGSFSPLGLFGTIFPYTTTSITSCLYIGTFSLFFVIFYFYLIKKQTHLRGLVLILILSIFLALGKYNPLYAAVLKLTGFYSFRGPSKFLFFGSFALSVMAGCGLTAFFESNKKGRKKKAISVFRWILFVSGVLFLAVKFILYSFKGKILAFGSWYVKNFIYNSFHHRYSLDYYLAKVDSIYNSIVSGFSFSQVFVILSWIFLVVALTVFPIILRRRLKRVAILVIFVDIFIFSFYGTGFRGNIKPFEYLKPTHTKILDILKADNEPFRIAPFGLTDENMPFWAKPNANAIFGLDSIAAYTPLAGKDYKQRLLPLEIVDDSLGILSPQDNALSKTYQDLKLLNVKYVVSSRRLKYGFLKEITSDDGAWLYELKDYLPRVFFTYRIYCNIRQEPAQRLNIAEYRNSFLRVKISTDKDGFLVFSENCYPDWHAFIDGKETEALEVKGLAQGVRLPAGTHTVVFRYKPDYLSWKR